MEWIETARISVDPLEVEGIVIQKDNQVEFLTEKGRIVIKGGKPVKRTISLYHVKLITKSRGTYHISTFNDEESAQKLKRELTRKIQTIKEEFFNETWERLIATLAENRLVEV